MVAVKVVQPIKAVAKVRELEQVLRERSFRDYMMFELGIYSGLRISDILRLRVGDLRGREYFLLREQKTGKGKRLAIHPKLKQELGEFLANRADDEFVFKSRVGENRAITREMAWGILSEAAGQVGLTEIGTHSLRKTFGYHTYMNSGKNIGLVQSLLNHSSSRETLRYIGIEQDSMDEAVCGLSY
jgi:integrase